MTYCAFLLTMLMAFASMANPFTVTFQNPGEDLVYEEVYVYAGVTTDPTDTAVTNCPPGMTCMVTIGLLPGLYPGSTIVARNGEVLSDHSNTQDWTVEPPTCPDFDYIPDGYITTADFGMFLGDYTQGYWTTADYGTFMTYYGGPCSP